MATDNRPLSPHLQVYRPQLTTVLSISHRLTGIVLTLGLVPVVLWALAVASGPDAYQSLMGTLHSIPGLILLVAWTFALFFHLLNGIRHLIWDAGWMLDLRGAYASGWAVLVLALVLTIAVWGGLA
jgi:succinate dehydrogenase / fumarate reductase, cytochrome b subunit